MDFKRIYEPKNDIEMMAIKALFDEHGISYMIEGEQMRSVMGGIETECSTVPILVREDHFERASGVLQEFLEKKRQPAKRRRTR